MKNFILSLLFVIFLSLNVIILSQVEHVTMHSCCSPYGFCDLRIFESKQHCNHNCRGTNWCVAKTVQVAAHPITGVPVAHTITPIAGVTTGITTGAIPVVTPGVIATARPVITLDTSATIPSVARSATTLGRPVPANVPVLRGRPAQRVPRPTAIATRERAGRGSLETPEFEGEEFQAPPSNQKVDVSFEEKS